VVTVGVCVVAPVVAKPVPGLTPELAAIVTRVFAGVTVHVSDTIVPAGPDVGLIENEMTGVSDGFVGNNFPSPVEQPVRSPARMPMRTHASR
jgi:hypothetical protein